MKIALIGYGKMGKSIERLAIEKGHEIVLKISKDNLADLTTTNIQQADVCIEFSSPESAFQHVTTCLKAGVATICGSTGWLHNLADAKKCCLDNNNAFLYASNFSIGVNLFFEINRMVARLMNTHPEYMVAIEEIHHTQKKDAPSGTAVTLAEDILNNIDHKSSWVNEPTNEANRLSIVSKRIDPAPGTHIISYDTEIDSITLTHTAHSRVGFASGALLAAEFLYDKKGIFSMKDVLKF